MALNASSALGGLAAGQVKPEHDSGSNKDDDAFDSAFSMAMFAIPSAIAMPVTAAQQKSEGATNASADAVAVAGGNRSQATTSLNPRDLASVGDPVGVWSRFAHAGDASLEDVADSTDSSQPADGTSALRSPALDDNKSSDQASNAPAQQTSAGTSAPNFLENLFGGTLGASVEIEYHAKPGSEPIADGTPAAAAPTSNPIADGAPALGSSTSDPAIDGAPVWARLKPVPLPDPSSASGTAKATHVTSQSDAASNSNCSGEGESPEPAMSLAIASGAGEISDATRAQAISTAESNNAPSKPAANAASPAAGNNTASSAASSAASQSAANGATPLSGQSSETLIANAIQQAANAKDRAPADLEVKNNPGSKLSSEPAPANNSGADLAAAPAIVKGPSEITATGSTQPTGAVAPTLRAFPTPPSDARIANLTIDLAGGQTTHATVRENAGAVEVRIVTSSQQSAQAISSELPNLRRALDSAGLQLKAADVSHHGSDQNGRGGNQQDNPSPYRQPGDRATFILEEVNQ